MVRRSFIARFIDTAAAKADAPAVRIERCGDVMSRSWAEVDRARFVLASGLVSHVLHPRKSAAIIAHPSLPWLIADLAIQSCGAHAVLVDPTIASAPGELARVLDETGTTIAFVEEPTALEGLLTHRSHLPRLRKIVVMACERPIPRDSVDNRSDPLVVHERQVVRFGEERVAHNDKDIEERSHAQTEDDLCAILVEKRDLTVNVERRTNRAMLDLLAATPPRSVPVPISKSTPISAALTQRSAWIMSEGSHVLRFIDEAP